MVQVRKPAYLSRDRALKSVETDAQVHHVPVIVTHIVREIDLYGSGGRGGRGGRGGMEEAVGMVEMEGAARERASETYILGQLRRTAERFALSTNLAGRSSALLRNSGK